MRFLGNSEAKTDAKGRVFLPAVFRKQLQAASQECLILRKDTYQDCLVLYPENVWNEQMNELRCKLNRWNSRHQMIFRQFVSDVEVITLDGNGRFLIPKRYLKLAKIQQDVRFIGLDDTIEIWSKEIADKPFITPEDFGKELEEIMGTNSTAHLYSFDQDEDAEKNIVSDSRFTFVRSNFRYLPNFLRYYGVEGVDAILADLGVSSHHFDDSERGFSFRFEGKLDMRMNKRAGMTAADVVNTYDEERLANIFYLYGELKNSRKLASAIVKARGVKQIVTIGDFLEVIKPLFGREREKKELAKVFQALRIEVNQEMEALKEMLYAATKALKPGGRLVVITYHSLEDRMVKNIMKTGNIEGKAEQDFFGNVQTPFKLVNNKVIVAGNEEVTRNPRSRSAKLRIAEKR